MRSIFKKAPEPELTLAYFKKEAEKALKYKTRLTVGRELSKQRYDLTQHVAGLIADIDENNGGKPLDVLNLLGQAILHNQKLTADYNAELFKKAQSKGKMPNTMQPGSLNENLKNAYAKLVTFYNKCSDKQAPTLETLISDPIKYKKPLPEDRTKSTSKQTVNFEELAMEKEAELNRGRPSRTDSALEDEAERAVYGRRTSRSGPGSR